MACSSMRFFLGENRLKTIYIRQASADCGSCDIEDFVLSNLHDVPNQHILQYLISGRFLLPCCAAGSILRPLQSRLVRL